MGLCEQCQKTSKEIFYLSGTEMFVALIYAKFKVVVVTGGCVLMQGAGRLRQNASFQP